MLSCPCAAWIVRISDIESWRETPIPVLIHEEGDVLDMVVLIASEHVEESAADLFFEIDHWQFKTLDRLDGFFVGDNVHNLSHI